MNDNPTKRDLLARIEALEADIAVLRAQLATKTTPMPTTMSYWPYYPYNNPPGIHWWQTTSSSISCPAPPGQLVLS